MTKKLGNPFERDLKKLIRDPDYESRTPYLEKFHEDLRHILHAYVGSGSCFVFVDDLDRVETSLAADLMQAIHLVTAVQETSSRGTVTIVPRLYFILGIDKQVVASAIASKHEKMIPFMARAYGMETANCAQLPEFGIRFGLELLEKFIQLSVRLPNAHSKYVTRIWVTDLTGYEGVLQEAGPQGPDRSVSDGRDPAHVVNAVWEVAVALSLSPRRVKRLLNVVRLQRLLLIEMDSLRHIEEERELFDNRLDDDILTRSRIAMVFGILFKWPTLSRDLDNDPYLLHRLSQPSCILLHDADKQHARNDGWFAETELRSLLVKHSEGQLSLKNVDVSVLLRGCYQ
jgi:hypothetical protein